MTEFELKKSYFPSQTVSTCNKSRHLRERGKEAVRCCLLASQQATEVIPARQPFYTLLGAKLSLCETWAQSWMTARGQWSRYVAPPLWKLPAKGRSHITAPLPLCSHPWLRPIVPVQSSMTMCLTKDTGAAMGTMERSHGWLHRDKGAWDHQIPLTDFCNSGGYK